VRVRDVDKNKIDDAFWPLLGYHTGTISQNHIPIIFGLENFAPTLDNLKAFSAAFATTSSVPMYHIAAVTPEADDAKHSMHSSVPNIDVSITDLLKSFYELNSATTDTVDAVCLGNPHFSVSECAELASLCKGRGKQSSVALIVTLGREVYDRAKAAGSVNILEDFGVQFINDTCWCMIQEPIIPSDAKVLMTNSGKYAHYGPGLVNCAMHFGSLAECVDTACTGKRKLSAPDWKYDETT